MSIYASRPAARNLNQIGRLHRGTYLITPVVFVCVYGGVLMLNQKYCELATIQIHTRL